jgi:hypothetical protein
MYVETRLLMVERRSYGGRNDEVDMRHSQNRGFRGPSAAKSGYQKLPKSLKSQASSSPPV